VGSLALPAIAWGGETAPGSTETLTVKAPNEREVGKPMMITVEGMADGLHRLFVYGEAGREQGCETWPYQQQAQIATATLTSPEGDPLGPGPFVKSFVVLPATASTYLVCAYLDTTASSNPDVFEYGCYVIPATLNSINCYRSYEPWWVAATAGKAGQEKVEQAERKRRKEAEAEQTQLRTNVEAAAREAKEEEERRRASERKAREATLRRCTVPQLRRHTLAGARRLLRNADCRLGRVTIHHHGHGTLVVKSQTPRPGKTLPPRSDISIVLGLRAGQSP
jgi:hypothetical protein